VPVGPETIRLATRRKADIDAQVDAETRRLVSAWVREFNALLPELDAALADLAAAGVDGEWPSRAQITRSSRIWKAIAHAEHRLTTLANAAEVNLVNAAGEVVDLAVTLEPRLIASQLPRTEGPTAKLAASFDQLDTGAVDAIVARTTEQIHSLTRPLSTQAAEVMRQELVRAIPAGDNPKTTARRMLKRLEGGFNGGLTRALVISRTELIDASRAGAQAQQQANADVLAGWVWSATLDTTTCPSCWAMHGTEYALDEDGPLDHQQGRCVRLPLLKTWRELGYDLDEPPSVIPDAQATFGAMSQADQLAVMGPSRLEALQSGRMGWDDLSARRSSDGWRDSYGVAPVGAAAG
jgi:hypothetical protein